MLSARIKSFARSLGFDLVGIAPADRSAFAGYFRQWLDSGQHGSMKFLADRFEERTEPDRYLPGAQSVICVALNYHVRLQDPPIEEASGRVARYALGQDYHKLIKDRLYELADWLGEQAPGSATRACVDTAPVMEKELAQRAGIGWIGKNTCLINAGIGSWLLLGEVLTTLQLPPDAPATDHCGTCTRCLDACPTDAITAPFQLDARRCISYLTIEHRDELPQDLQVPIGDWLYGCDICQEVCPHNRQAPETGVVALQPRFPAGTIDVNKVLGWDRAAYQAQLRNSAMKRIKLPQLHRNAQIVAQNLSKKHRGA